MYSIETHELMKVFNSHLVAVNRINLKVEKGELFGLLGPNGAGKTTTINMLNTLLKPTGGTARVGGFDVVEQATDVRLNIGTLPQTPNLYEDLTAMENIYLTGQLYDMGRSSMEERAKRLLETVDLWDRRNDLAGTYSGGMKQRLSLVIGLLHEPSVLFMDEPTIGLDPQTKLTLRSLTKELQKQGMTIIYTTHDMEEADKLCDRIAIVDHGKLVAMDTPKGLKKMIRSKSRRARITCRNKRVDEELRVCIFTKQLFREGDKVELIFEESDGVEKKLGAIAAKYGGKVDKVVEIEPTMEDVFIELTGRKLRE